MRSFGISIPVDASTAMAIDKLLQRIYQMYENALNIFSSLVFSFKFKFEVHWINGGNTLHFLAET